MIQRIQSIYLFLSFLLIGGYFVFPVVNFTNAEGVAFEMNAFSLQNITDTTQTAIFDNFPIAILAGIIAILYFITIFLFKNRILQSRLCILNMLLIIGQAGLVYFYSSMAESEISAVDTNYDLVNIVLPVVLLLTYIAHKRIRLDEALVKSYDRIR